MHSWSHLVQFTSASPFSGAGASLATALLMLIVLTILRRQLAREHQENGSVLRLFLILGVLLSLLRLGLLLVGADTNTVTRMMAILSTFFVAMGAIGTVVMGVFEVLPARVNLRFPVLMRDLVLVLGFVVVLFGALGQSGIDVAHFVTTSAILTAIVGLALQSTLTNVLAGITLHMDRTLNVGDWIQFGIRTGRISEIRWRSTVLRTSDQDVVIIPNAQILAQEVQNFSRPLPLHRASVRVAFAYHHSPDHIRRILVDAIKATPHVLDERAPDCFPVEFGDSAVVYVLRFWIDRFDLILDIKGDVLSRVWYAAQREGLEIPFPMRTVVQRPQLERDEHGLSGEEMSAHLAAIEQVDLFTALTPDERRLLARGLRGKLFAPGEDILAQGQPGDSMFIVASGNVQVFLAKENLHKTVASLSGGDFMGEISLMTGEPRTATCRAVTETRCYELDHATFQNLLIARPAIADQMSTILVSRQRTLEFKSDELRSQAQASPAETQRDLLQKIKRFFDLRS